MRLIATLVAALISISAPAHAGIPLPEPPEKLTLEEALESAMQNNPQIKAARAEVARWEGQAFAMSVWPLRAVSANVAMASQLPPGPGGITPPTAGGYLTINVGDLIGGAGMARSALAQVDFAKENLRTIQLQVATAVTEAYSAWQTQSKLLALRQEAIRASKSDVVVVERLFGRGGANVNDLLKARLAVSQSQADLAQAEGEYSRACAALLQQMGDTAWLSKRTSQKARK